MMTTIQKEGKPEVNKRDKKNQGKKKIVKGKQIHERINYLYELALLTYPSSRTLSRHYISLMMDVAQREVIRLAPSIKRTFCKKCCSVMIPGDSCTVRINPLRSTHATYTCLHCSTIYRFNFY